MRIARFDFLALAAALLACAGCQTATVMQDGRQALLAGRYDEALARFQDVAAKDPQFSFASGPFTQGIWTYVGRTQYATGNLPEARRSLERALSMRNDDYVAHLYLGLTLARTGDRAAGLPAIVTGMRGLHNWLDYLTFNTRFGVYWDPNREIRTQIEKDLDSIDKKTFAWPQLIANGEWLGNKMEQEVDIARRNEQYELQRGRDRFPGSGVGVGFGF
ncbi:MAG TPA: tetratricopeptide repeat protein [Candidatus Binatia bacterium]|jgi:tetratricopeptide (TPR) repeat protein